ncbi:hypothetical protein BV25DRAFT_1818370 [Artomyces pyxidatus]|uniref:Uncharacterized protein n=1 Tax=Artomyces pyxidatus TaxID=48021 RepID=A0ACB8THZ7_9AGAM|nr:hypothetical protein BV25DRAFT_1818370 [Artomyces pyxidatus]
MQGQPLAKVSSAGDEGLRRSVQCRAELRPPLTWWAGYSAQPVPARRAVLYFSNTRLVPSALLCLLYVAAATLRTHLIGLHQTAIIIAAAPDLRGAR